MFFSTKNYQILAVVGEGSSNEASTRFSTGLHCDQLLPAQLRVRIQLRVHCFTKSAH